MEGEWLTYGDAAKRLRIKTDSVKRRARSRKWPKRAGNDGAVSILIPADALRDVRADVPEAPLADIRPDVRDIEQRAARAEAKAEVLAEQVNDLRAERDKLIALLESRPVQSRGLWSLLFGR